MHHVFHIVEIGIFVKEQKVLYCFFYKMTITVIRMNKNGNLNIWLLI